MGSCCVCDRDAAPRHPLPNRQDDLMNPTTVNILLLGTSQSGKTTFVKQLKRLCNHEEAIFNDVKDLDPAEHSIRQVQALVSLLKRKTNSYSNLINIWAGYDIFADSSNTSTSHTTSMAINMIPKVIENLIIYNYTFGLHLIDNCALNSIDYIHNLTQNNYDLHKNITTKLGNMKKTKNKDVSRLQKHMNQVWNNLYIQQTFYNREQLDLELNEGSTYFFNNIDLFFDEYNLCTDFDAQFIHECSLKQYTQTIEKNEFVFEYNHRDVPLIKTIDCGGMQIQRLKWVELFKSNLNFIIYFMSLIDFDYNLYENENKNAMLESFELFEDLCKLKYLKHLKTFVIFLNKYDIFKRFFLFEDEYCKKKQERLRRFLNENFDGLKNFQISTSARGTQRRSVYYQSVQNAYSKKWTCRDACKEIVDKLKLIASMYGKTIESHIVSMSDMTQVSQNHSLMKLLSNIFGL